MPEGRTKESMSNDKGIIPFLNECHGMSNCIAQPNK
jgi:hypothetical protein